MSVQALAKEVSISHRKMEPVAALVRGRAVTDAAVILEHTPRRAAHSLLKTINSAAANAKNNHNLDAKKLTIETIDIGPGSPMKRFRPAAHGRALPYKKHTTNIRVVVAGPEKKSAKKKTETKKSETKESSDKEKK